MIDDEGQEDTGTPESHGVYGGTTRDDAAEQEDPTPTEGAEEWADKVETGGDATE